MGGIHSTSGRLLTTILSFPSRPPPRTLRIQFAAKYDAADAAANPSSHDFGAFNGYLSRLLATYNEHPSSDPVRAAQAELKGVKDIMQANIEQVLNRGERLELLVDRTDQAANQSLQFRRRAVGLRRQMWWKNVKVLGMAGFCAVVSGACYGVLLDHSA